LPSAVRLSVPIV